MITPRISFLCPSYNHEQFVSGFINSVLSQTVHDWELVIIDDCSSDNTAKVIQSFKDSRIRFVRHNRNQGFAATVNEAYLLSLAPVVALIASDDELMPDYAKAVLGAFEADLEVGVVYSPLAAMSESGELTGRIICKTKPVPTEDYFRELFLNDNFLQSPGMAIRRKFAEKIFPRPFGLFQYFDVAIHMALAFCTRAWHLERPVVKYRINGGSASSMPEQNTLCIAETALLMDEAVRLVGHNIDMFNKFFGACPELVSSKISPDAIPFWMGRLALTSILPEKRIWGLQKIISIINHNGGQGATCQECGVEFKDLISLLKTCDRIRFCHAPNTMKKKRVFPGIWKAKVDDFRVLSVFSVKLMYKCHKEFE